MPDRDVFRAEVGRHKWPVAMDGSGTGGQLRWLWIDARESLGHRLEYCWLTAERWAALGGHARRPPISS